MWLDITNIGFLGLLPSNITIYLQLIAFIFRFLVVVIVIFVFAEAFTFSLDYVWAFAIDFTFLFMLVFSLVYMFLWIFLCVFGFLLHFWLALVLSRVFCFICLLIEIYTTILFEFKIILRGILTIFNTNIFIVKNNDLLILFCLISTFFRINCKTLFLGYLLIKRWYFYFV